MPNRQGIDAIANIEACKQNAKELRDIIKEVGTDIKTLPQITLQYKSAEGLTELKKAHEQLAALNQKNIELSKQLDSSTKKVAETEKQLADIREKNSKANKARTDEEIRASIQQREETKRRTDAIKAESDAYKQLTLQYNQAAAEAKKLQAEALTDPSKAAKAEETAKKAKAIWDQLKGIDASVGQFFKNVGNYPESAKIIVDALERQKEKVAAVNKEFGEMHPAGAAARKELEALQRVTDSPQFLNISAKVGDSNAELKAFTKTLIELDRQGLGNTDFATELRKHLAELKDEIDDTKSEIKKLASDSHAFDEFARSVSFLASTYQTAIGAQELFGGSSKEVEESMKKLLAVQALANGTQQIAQQLTEKGTLINKGYVAIQTLVKTALDSTAAASVRAAAATKLLLGGLAIGALIYVIMKLKDWSEATIKLSADQRILNTVREKAIEGYSKEVAGLEVLRVKLQDSTIPQGERIKLVKEYNKNADEGNKIDLKQISNINLLNSAIDRQIVKIKERALAQAAANVTEDAASKLFLAQQELNKNHEKFVLNLDKIDEQIEQARKKREDLVQDYSLDLHGVTQQMVIDQGDLLNGLRKIKEANDEFSRSAKLTAKLPQSEKPKEEKAKTNTKSENEQIAKGLRARFDLYKIEKERELEILQQTIDDESAGWIERLTAAMRFIDIKQKLILDEANFEKSTGKKSADEKLLIDKKAYYDTIRVAEDTEKKVSEIGTRIKDKLKTSVNNVDTFNQAPESSVYKEIMKQMDAYQKKQAEIAEKEKSYHEERKARLKELVEEVKQTTYEFLIAPIEKQKNALAAKQEVSDKNYEKEVENINNSTLNEEQKAARLKVLEAEHVAQKEQTARKIHELDIKKSKFDRDKSIVDIIQSTATAIIKTLAQYPGPQGIILSAIIGGIGAAQLARAIATPIPKYFRGRLKNDPYEGPALAGEVKPELMVRNDGSMEVIDKPTIVDVKKGDQIFPDAKEIMSFENMQNRIVSSAFRSMMLSTGNNDKTSDEVSKMRNDMKEFFVWQTNQLKEAMKSKQPININISDFKNSDYIRRSVKE